MKLCRLLNRVAVFEIRGDVMTEVVGLSHSTKEISVDYLFFCIEGIVHDGHNFAKKAVERGATVVVSERYIDGLEATQVIVKNTRAAMSVIAQNFYDNPAEKLRLIAVTGTNGKTSVCYIMRAILEKANKHCGVIGTNGIWIRNDYFDCDLTTPDPIILNSTLATMKRRGVEYVLMEVSAHAIYLDKLEGIIIDIGVFTNLSVDHLDFFETMDKYAQAKESFFSSKHIKTAVVNADDDLGKRIISRAAIPLICYGMENKEGVYARGYTEGVDGMSFLLCSKEYEEPIECRLRGIFNVYNILAAATVCKILGIKTTAITHGILDIEYIQGRNMRYDHNGVGIVVDFAHSPDGIRNILGFLRKSTEGSLIAVFGCGGDRDKGKRKLMAEEASKWSDLIILTEDNSRSEAPENIIAQIEEGVGVPYKIIVKRKEAIKEALKIAEKGDIVAILGKGAEKYIIRKGGSESHSDVDYVTELLKNNGLK